jgi:hypothetical protein
VVGKTAETFRNNNFAYAGEKGGVHVTLLENNHVDPRRPETYEAVLVYLIRRDDELDIQVDRHALGLFPQSYWEEVFLKLGLSLTQSRLEGTYDAHLLAKGEYTVHVFVGQRAG